MPELDDDLTLPGQPPRRTVLRGALALGAAGVLAGCGGSSSDNNSAAQAPAPAAPESTPSPTAAAKKKKAKATATPTSEAKATSSAKPKATTAAKPKGTELGPTSEIPVGGGKIFDAQKIVVTQPKKGEFLGFTSICSHQACELSDVDGGTINCGCHNSSFDITTGAPDGGPATEPLAKKKVSVVGGKVYEV